MSGNLAATLIATLAGVASWFFGLAKEIWPAHPQIAAFLLTLVTGIVVTVLWPADDHEKT